MIKLLEAAIEAQKETLGILKKETHPQLVEDRIRATGRLEALEAVLDYQRSRKALLRIMAQKRE